jgi:hypothetical protein
MSTNKLPILQTAILCQDIETDCEGRPFKIVEPIHTLRWSMNHPEGQAYRPPTLNLYLCFAEGDGKFMLRAELRRFGSDISLYRTRPESIELDIRDIMLIPIEYAVSLNGLDIPEPGDYRIILLLNHVAMNDPINASPRSQATIDFNVLKPAFYDPQGGAV